MRSTLMTLVLAGVVPAGCQSGSGQVTLGQVAAPMELDDSVDSSWVYLAKKYDVDGDGRISEQEYQREGGRFDRLDRNDDGVVTAADFERTPGRREGMMRGMRAQRLVAVYFQIDEPGSLALDELGQAVAAYDDNGDGLIGEAEFAAHAEERKVEPPGGDSRMMKMAMRDVEPWAALVVAIDTDQDGRIAAVEFVAFFKDRDDGDLVWSLDRSRRRGGASSRPMSGPSAGEPAPDFALRPANGGPTVTLSSFRKNLPVALIFGSYT